MKATPPPNDSEVIGDVSQLPNRGFMKRHLLVLMMLACTGCAPAVTKVNVTDMAKSDALPLHDVRPASEKEDKIFSLLITSKEYGVLRAGDAKLSPAPVRLLQHEAFQKFASADHAPQVTVHHLVIYENMRSQLRSGAIGAGVGGVIGGLIGNAVANHDSSSQTHIIDEMSFNSVSEEYLRGQYDASENPDKGSVFIIYVDTDIDGKKVFTRTIASMKPHGDQNAFADAVQLAIKNHLSRYDASVTAAAPTASMTPAALVAPATASAPAVLATSRSSQMASAEAATTSIAQGVANQMGCGPVRASGDSTFVASCGSYDVAIDCDGAKCHPTHTMKANQ
ncbi:hypothetical protein [Dyella sp. Tek66A03]|uniref:hypothetical protein n=1 Tax=Dyella sp. Tek66A03 TaxID=3458298 RepID=UPI00403ED86A